MSASTLTDLKLVDLLDLYFAGLGEVEAQREVAGGKTWRASLLGNCLRRQYIELVEKRPTPPPDARTQRIFQVGHLTGQLIERAFRKLGVLIAEEYVLTDDEWNIGAHVDFLVGGPVLQPDSADPLESFLFERVTAQYGPVLPTIGVELKSKNSRAFHYGRKNGGVVAGTNQLIQAAAYDLLARKAGLHVDRWAVLSIAKDDLTMVEDEVLERHRDKALDRIEALNAATGPEDLPCDCFEAFGGKGWKFCPYGVSSSQCC